MSRLFGRQVELARIGRYVRIHRLGQRGMGIAYAA